MTKNNENVHLYIENNDTIVINVYIQGPAQVTPLSVAGRVCECLTLDGQQFEHFP